MKIGDAIPSKDIPRWGAGKYGDVWEQAKKLPSGEALPLKFDTKKQAQSFASGYNHQARGYGLKLVLRQDTIYITQRDGGSE